MVTTVLPRSTRRCSDVDQALDVGEVEAGGRLVEHVEGRAARFLAELVGELDALRFAAGERVRRLAEGEVAESDVAEEAQAAFDRGDGGEELQLLHRHRQHVGDRLAAVGRRERLFVEAPIVALFAGDVHVGEEAHLHTDASLTGAALAPSALDVEREPRRGVAAQPRLRGAGEEPADLVEEADVRGRDRARGSADRGLIHLVHALHGLRAGRAPVASDGTGELAELLLERAVEHVADQRRLAGARYAGDARPGAERDLDVDVLRLCSAAATIFSRGRRSTGRGWPMRPGTCAR